MTKMTKKPKFSVGQVVRIDAEFYKKQRKDSQYQRIVSCWSWPGRLHKPHPFGYTFLNGDECNEKYIKSLSPKELGR